MEIEEQFRAPREHRLRILIVRVGAMGDVLHALPAVAALRQALPDCWIGWAVEPRWASLLVSDAGEGSGPRLSHDETAARMGHGVGGRMGHRAGPVVDRIHLVPTRQWKARPFSVATLRQIANLRREMKAEHYDVCVDLQGSIKSAVVGRMAEALRFVGPRRPRERQARALYGERFAVSADHVIGQACELVTAAAGLSGGLNPAQVSLPVDASAERWCDALPAAREDFVLLAPGGGWGAKQWPVEQYQCLAARLRSKGLRVLVNASRPESETAARIAGDPASVIVSTLPQLIALTRRAGLVIGGDTGPMHLAAALGRPVLALFGPTDPARNGPFFPGNPGSGVGRVRVLRHPSSRMDHGRHAATEAGLARITVDEVAAAALAMHAQNGGEGGSDG